MNTDPKSDTRRRLRAYLEKNGESLPEDLRCLIEQAVSQMESKDEDESIEPWGGRGEVVRLAIELIRYFTDSPLGDLLRDL